MKTFYPSYTDGKLDPQAEEILLRIASSNEKPLSELTPEEARERSSEKSWLGEPDPSVKVKDILIDGTSSKIPLRIYTPEGTGPFPVLVYFHGGGFVTGSLNESDPFCSRVSGNVHCIVVSVDYRLAPEHKFPTAVEDSADAIKWVLQNAHKIEGDPLRVALAGESAGANLACASILISTVDGLPPLTYLILMCPFVDARLTETESYKFFGDGLWLSRATQHWYRSHYIINEKQALSPLASPFVAEDFGKFPTTLIITAEFDVLRSEGEEFANFIRADGVTVRLSRYSGMLHGFTTLPGLFSKAKDAEKEICDSLKEAFNKD